MSENFTQTHFSQEMKLSIRVHWYTISSFHFFIRSAGQVRDPWCSAEPEMDKSAALSISGSPSLLHQTLTFGGMQWVNLGHKETQEAFNSQPHTSCIIGLLDKGSSVCLSLRHVAWGILSDRGDRKRLWWEISTSHLLNSSQVRKLVKTVSSSLLTLKETQNLTPTSFQHHLRQCLIR